MGFSLHGADALIKELDHLYRDALYGRQILTQAGSKVERLARIKAPVNKNRKAKGKGNLRRSIKANVRGTKVVIRAGADYAGYVEFGTRFMDAQPYLQPALDEVQPEFERLLWEKLKR